MAYHSIYGRRLGVNEFGTTIARRGIAIGSPAMSMPSPVHCAWFDDFLGGALDPRYTALKGTDASGNVPSAAILAGTLNGVLRLVGGDSAGTMAADGAQIVMGRHWRAQDTLEFEARVRLTTLANVSVFVGLMDGITLLAPVTGSGTTFTNNITNAVGFLYDSALADTSWWGVNAVAGIQNISSGQTPVAATWTTLRVELDSNGNALLYINGVPFGKAKLPSSVVPSVLLTPTISIFPRTAAFGTQVDVDYLAIGSRRS